MGSCVWLNRQHRSVGWSCGILAFVCQQIAWFAVVASGNRPGFKLTCIVHKYRCRAVSLSSRQVVVGVIVLVHYFVIIAEFVATVWLMFWQCWWSICCYHRRSCCNSLWCDLSIVMFFACATMCGICMFGDKFANNATVVHLSRAHAIQMIRAQHFEI